MILQMLDDNVAMEKQVYEVKLALGTGKPELLPEIFPQWFGKPDLALGTDEADRALASGNAVEDYSEVEWLSPRDFGDEDMAEMMKLSEALFASSQITVTQDPTGEWV